MPTKDVQTHLRDILRSIDHIASFTTDMDFDAYEADIKTKSAVERQMQIVSEAAIRLRGIAEGICAGPDWQGLRKMGDILRHAYHRVDDRIVWDTVMYDLPILKAAVIAALNAEPES